MSAEHTELRRMRYRRALPADFDPRTRNIPAGTEMFARILKLHVPNTRWYLHPARQAVYELRQSRVHVDDDDEGTSSDAEGDSLGEYFRPVFAWGCPRLVSITRFADSDASEGQRAIYRIEVAGDARDVSYKALHSGTCWESWACLGVSVVGWRAINALCALVESQALATLQDTGDWHVPVFDGKVATGWTTLTDGRHTFALPDGRVLGAAGLLVEERAHLSLLDRAIAPYRDVPATTAMLTADSRVAQEAALAFVCDLGQHSAGSLMFLCALRSLLCSLFDADFALIVRGPTQTGKSSLTSWLRNLTGSFTGWPLPRPTASFLGTVASLERPLGELRDIPATVDDLVILPGDTPARRAEKEQAVEGIVRARANGVPMRARMNQDLQERIAYLIGNVPIITAEELPRLRESLLARTILLDLQRGDLDLTQLRTGDMHANGLRSLGWRFLIWLAGQWDREGDALPGRLRARHAQLARELRADLAALLPGGNLPGDCERLPSNGAHLLLAYDVLMDYCRDAKVAVPFDVTVLRRDLLLYLASHVATIQRTAEGGDDTGVAESLPEWVTRIVREALGGQRRHLLDHTGACPGNTSRSLEALGWRRQADEKYVPCGPRLGWIDEDDTAGVLYCDVNAFAQLLREQAKREGRVLPGSTTALYRRLAEAGVVEREGKQTSKTKRIAGHHEQVLVVPQRTIWPDEADMPADDGRASLPDETLSAGPVPKRLFEQDDEDDVGDDDEDGEAF